MGDGDDNDVCLHGGADTSDNMSALPTQIPTERGRKDTALQRLLFRVWQVVMMTKVKETYVMQGWVLLTFEPIPVLLSEIWY